MDSRKKVGFATKFLSNRNYLKEVSVEGKTTNKFNFKIGLYDQYAVQIIRSGNCITLLSNDITINKDRFFNPNYFEDLTKYVFWTFNKSFQSALIETIDTLSLSVVGRCADLLQENFTPYHAIPENSADEELQWCMVKNEHLKKDPKFEQMYVLDKENRSALLGALSEKITLSKTAAAEAVDIPKPETAQAKTVSFLEVLTPLNDNPAETLHFIISKLAEASFEFSLLSKIDKLPNGKNP